MMNGKRKNSIEREKTAHPLRMSRFKVLYLFYGSEFFHSWQDFGRDELDVSLNTAERHASKIHLGDITLVAEHFVLIKNLFDDLLRAADVHHMVGMRALHEMRLWKTTAVRAHHAFIHMWVTFFKCLLGRFSGVEKAGCRDRELSGIEAVFG